MDNNKTHLIINPEASEFWKQMLDAPMTKLCDCEGECDHPTKTIREVLQDIEDTTGIPVVYYGAKCETATEAAMEKEKRDAPR